MDYIFLYFFIIVFILYIYLFVCPTQLKPKTKPKVANRFQNCQKSISHPKTQPINFFTQEWVPNSKVIYSAASASEDFCLTGAI